MSLCVHCSEGSTTTDLLAHDGLFYCRTHWNRLLDRNGYKLDILPSSRPPYSMFIDYLHEDDQFCILQHLDERDLRRALRVCRLWKRLGLEIFKRFSIPPPLFKTYLNRMELELEWQDTTSTTKKNQVTQSWEVLVESPDGLIATSQIERDEKKSKYEYKLDLKKMVHDNKRRSVFVTLRSIGSTGSSAKTKEIILPPLTNLNGQRTVKGGCFGGKTLLLLANGSVKEAREIQGGDWLRCGDGRRRKVAWIERQEAPCLQRLCIIRGVILTRGHPVWVQGNWVRPDELVEAPEGWHCDGLFNLALDVCEGERHELSRAVITASPNRREILLCSTLGCDCGERLRRLYPANHLEFCVEPLEKLLSLQTATRVDGLNG